ncbi:hypothetical protein EV141_0389 [Microcella putealis]|uniref:ATP synthase protein I n=1 Tax=Microcella putealis TaxID=337005 RepID=A0A4Q7LXJ5_9MICO|nr:hypothetical protein [Microcella putealis]RZS59172.1 hypothetical protein EV141_0389 [Microcella putealis]TQM24198.1 hypothetical protein BJ957_1668 [Microcella putealis]
MNVERTLKLSLVYGGVVSFLIAIVGSVVGALVADLPGLLAALIGAAVGFLFVGITALSVLIAVRSTKDDPSSPLFFVIIMGAWLLKLVGFIVFTAVFRTVEGLDPVVLFVCLISAAVGSVGADVVAVLRSRIPYTEPPLPGAVAD